MQTIHSLTWQLIFWKGCNKNNRWLRSKATVKAFTPEHSTKARSAPLFGPLFAIFIYQQTGKTAAIKPSLQRRPANKILDWSFESIGRISPCRGRRFQHPNGISCSEPIPLSPYLQRQVQFPRFSGFSCNLHSINLRWSVFLVVHGFISWLSPLDTWFCVGCVRRVDFVYGRLKCT